MEKIGGDENGVGGVIGDVMDEREMDLLEVFFYVDERE